MCLDDICFNIGAENPLLGCTVLYSSKTIEEKPTITFVTDLLASEQLSAVMFKVAYYSFQKRKITFLKLTFKASRSFILGYLLLQLLKEMILTLVILEKKYEKFRKYQI